MTRPTRARLKAVPAEASDADLRARGRVAIRKIASMETVIAKLSGFQLSFAVGALEWFAELPGGEG